MGANGRIAYFDADKVEKIKKEVREKYPDEKVYFRGYRCDYTVNGRKVVLSYWGDNAWCGWGAEGSQLRDSCWGIDEPSEAQKEFAKRIATEAVIVEDQEVWT